jgi:predicted transcriptional regulator
MSKDETTLLKELNEKIDKILTVQYHILSIIEQDKCEHKPLDVFELLELPDHIRKTAMAMNKLKEATAEDVSLETGRERSIESAYLNQLVRYGYIQKRREGRKVIFYFPNEVY